MSKLSALGSRSLAGSMLLALVACDRAEPVRARPPATAAAAPAEVAKAPPLTPPFTRHPGGPRMVAIGDLHGDFDATRAALRLAGATDASDGWVGGKLVVVQTGDQLDRGDKERDILDLLDRLTREAEAAGGALVVLNGNHETMNVQGDFRYVTPAGFRSFHGVSPASPFASQMSLAERDRAGAFLPGGGYANKLAQRDVVAVVEDTVFAHGGVLPEHVTYGLDRLNREVRGWMTGKERIDPALIAGDRAPVWTRAYGTQPSEEVCRGLTQVLQALGAKRLVVGHTIQASGISAACDGKVYRIDVGMSRYYGNNPIQVLEITDAGVRPLSGARDALLGQGAVHDLTR